MNLRRLSAALAQAILSSSSTLMVTTVAAEAKGPYGHAKGNPAFLFVILGLLFWAGAIANARSAETRSVGNVFGIFCGGVVMLGVAFLCLK